MRNALAGHTNSFHTYSREEALAGIAEAGYRTVELTAVEGWTEHVDLDADTGELRARSSTTASSRSALGPLRPDHRRRASRYGIKAVELAARLRPPRHEHGDRRPRGQEENESAFLANIEALADAAEDAGVDVALEIHGDIMASGARTLPLLERIGHPRIKVAYDTAQLRVLRRRQGRRRPRRRSSRTSPTCTSRTSAAARATGTSRLRATARSISARVLGILEAGGYEGPYSVEIEFQGDPWPPLAEVNASMTRACAHLNALGLG